MKFQHLLVAQYAQACHITINREAKLNALDRETLAELHEAISDVLSDDGIKGVVITGAGNKAFVAGADIADFADFDAHQAYELASTGQAQVFDLIHHAPKPFIAAINGFALGGGLELAMACHIRLSVPHARLGLPEVSLGLIPGYGGTQRLTQLVGRGRALQMILTGEMISAEQALHIGLVNELWAPGELLERADGLLAVIGSRSASAVAAAIKAVNAGLLPNENGYETEKAAFSSCFGTADFKEGVSAFLEKRKPRF
ncbi:enoyl-CoA hydratase [bacterium A37T11]|nr:enoyl-CoA hydratase [bacterium A37T11]